MPWVLLVLLIVLLATASAVGLAALVRRRWGERRSIRGTDDVEGIYVVVIGTLYGILVAFMIFVVWTDYSDAQRLVDREADALGDVYRLAGGLPQPYRDQVRGLSVEYARAVADSEWANMARGQTDPRVSDIVARMWQAFNALGPEEAADDVLRDHLLTSFAELTDLRRSRLLESETELPTVLYVVLIIGGILTVGFAIVFNTEHFESHAIKAGALAALVSLMLVTVWSLDHPFRGSVRIPPDAFDRVLSIVEER